MSKPDEVLKEILSRGGRSQKQGHLREIHDLCRKLNAQGHTDFSLKTIGANCEHAGIFKGKILYNKPSEDYRKLIRAWGEVSEALVEVPDPEPPPNQIAWLEKIPDRAIRALVQKLISDARRYKIENDFLRSKTSVLIDRRPRGSDPRWVETPVLDLTDSEQAAIENVISPDFLPHLGWEEGSHGEIIAESGRLLFDTGFLWALRKVIDYRKEWAKNFERPSSNAT